MRQTKGHVAKRVASTAATRAAWSPERRAAYIALIKERRAAGLYKKRRPASEETKARIRAAKLGHPLTPEHRAKLSAVRKGKPKSPAHRAAISRARLRGLKAPA